MRSVSKIMVCALMALVTGLGFGQPAPGPGPDRLERVLKSAGVSEAVVQQVTDLVDQGRVQARSKKAEIGVVQAQIRLALAAESPDLAALGVLVDKKAALVAELEKARLAEEVQIRHLVGTKVWDQLKLGLNRRFGPGR